MGKRVRKSLVAGLGAGLTAVVSTFVFTGAPTKDDIAKALGIFIVAFGSTAWATWRVRNAGADIGATGSTLRR